MNRLRALRVWQWLCILSAAGGMAGFIVFLSLRSPDQPVGQPRAEEQAPIGDSGVVSSEEYAVTRAYPSGLGLDAIQRRALTDPWGVARVRESGVIPGPPLNEHTVRKVRRALEQARRARKAEELEVAIRDGDGIPEAWVYYVGSRPVVVEFDRLGTGVHDLRVQLNGNHWTSTEYGYWTLSPPVPLPSRVKGAVRANHIFNWAVVAEQPGAGETEVEQLASLCLPGLRGQLARIADETVDRATGKDLSAWAAEAVRLRPKFTKLFGDNEALQKGLRASRGWTVHHEWWTKEPRLGASCDLNGVASVQFFQEHWKKKEGLLAECYFEGEQVVRIHSRGKRYLRIGGFWARINSKARLHIAQDLLGPAYHQYRANRGWYEALASAQQATCLAGLLGDLRVDGKGKPKRGTGHPNEGWHFTVEGHRASTLLEFAMALAWQGDRRTIGSLWGLASESGGRRDYAEALALYRLSERFSDKVGSGVGKATALVRMSEIYKRLGNYDQALKCLLKSLDTEATLDYVIDLSLTTEANVTEPHNLLKRNRAKAMQAHAMALKRAGTLARLAVLYADLGEQDLADHYLSQSERLLKNLGHRYLEADSLNLRARWDLASGRWQTALQRAQRALEMVQAEATEQQKSAIGHELYDRGKAGKCLSIVAPFTAFDAPVTVAFASESHPLCYQALSAGVIGDARVLQAVSMASTDPQRGKSLQQAAEAHQSALQWYEKAQEPIGAIASRLRLAEVALHQHDYRTTLEQATRALRDSEPQRVFETTWRALLLQGDAHRGLGRVADAEKKYEAAAGMIESMRASLHAEPIRVGFFRSKLRVYEELANLYQAGGEPKKVWRCMERARARSLLDVLAGQDLSPRGPLAGKVGKEQAALQPVWGGAAPGGPEDLEQVQRDLEEQLRKNANRPEIQEIISLRLVAPVGLEAVQAALDPEDLLVEYFVTERELLAALIRKRELKVIRLPGYGHARLRAQVKAFRQQVQNPAGSYRTLARRLYRDLLAPCLVGQEHMRHLCIVPAEELHYLPFQALMAEDGKFLLERYQVSYASSASTLVYAVRRREMQAKAPPLPALVVVPPGLRHAAAEGKKVFDMLPGPKKLLDGDNATRGRILANFPCSCFHFSGHADYRVAVPLRTGLLCMPDVEGDGRLEVRELFGRDLGGCRLAVLSACETHLGPGSRGDEVIGLSRAFLRARVPTVVSSLWKVEDAATAALMVEFHRGLWEGKTRPTKMAALNQAQLALLRRYDPRKGELRAGGGRVIIEPNPAQETNESMPLHPFYWAAFVLTGDWR